jgi:hypothetical protein
MKVFKDREGREWIVDVNIGSIKRVNDILNVDLLRLEGGQLVDQLIGDPVTLCNVVYVLCMKQAQERGVSDEDFGRAMAGDSIDHATTALLEDFVDFFPSRKRPAMAKALAKIKQIEAAQLEAAERMIDDPQIDQLIQKAMNEATASLGGRSFGATPPSSDSTLAA